MTDVTGLDVVVIVGTDHHPFDRLVGWVDRWAADREVGHRCLIQYGTASPPSNARAVDYLQRDDLLAAFAAARAVVSHGGPSTIVEALRHDRLPFVLARSPERGEHVDGHQERFAEAMSIKQMVRLVPDEQTLGEWLDAELARDRPTAVTVDLPPAEVAARTLGQLVADMTSTGPTRRLRALRRLRTRAPRSR